MSQSGPAPIVQVATQAWRDAFRVFRAMGPLVAVTAALAVLFAFVWAEALQAVDLKNLSKLQSLVPPVLSEAASNFILTPLVISRLSLHPARRNNSDLPPRLPHKRSWRFFLYLMLLSLALGVFRLVALLVSDPAQFSAFGVIASISAFIAYAVFDARTTLLFPALAIDVASANIKASFHDSRRHFWRITLIKLCTRSTPILSRRKSWASGGGSGRAGTKNVAASRSGGFQPDSRHGRSRRPRPNSTATMRDKLNAARSYSRSALRLPGCGMEMML